MSKIKLWENTHFDKIIAVYNDGTEEEIGYINENGDKVYYGSSPSATAPKKFYSDWNQRQYDAYKQRQNAQLEQNGRSPDFGTLLYQHNSNVLSGASDLMQQAQARQQANDRKVLKGVKDNNQLRQQQILRDARRYGNAGYGMMDNDLVEEYSFFEGDKYDSPKNYLDIIKPGGSSRGYIFIADEIVLKTIIVNENGFEMPIGTKIIQKEISQKDFNGLTSYRESIRYNSDYPPLKKSLQKGYIISGEKEIIRRRPNPKSKTVVTVIFQENGGFWKGTDAYNLVYIDEWNVPIEPIQKISIPSNTEIPTPKPIPIPPLPPLRLDYTVEIAFENSSNAIDYNVTPQSDVDSELSVLAARLNNDPSLILTIFGDTTNTTNSDIKMEINGGERKAPVSVLMLERANRIRQILIRQYGVRPSQVRTRLGNFGAPTYRVRAVFQRL